MGKFHHGDDFYLLVLSLILLLGLVVAIVVGVL